MTREERPVVVDVVVVPSKRSGERRNKEKGDGEGRERERRERERGGRERREKHISNSEK